MSHEISIEYVPLLNHVELVDLGTAPNAGNGDSLRDAFKKINNSLVFLDGNASVIVTDDDNRPLPEEYPNGKLWFGTKTDDSMQEIQISPQDKGQWRVEEEFINAIKNKEIVRLTTFDNGVDYMRFTQAVMDSYRENGRTKFL